MLSSNSFQTKEAPTSHTCSRACTAGLATLEVLVDTVGGKRLDTTLFCKTLRNQIYHHDENMRSFTVILEAQTPLQVVWE